LLDELECHQTSCPACTLYWYRDGIDGVEAEKLVLFVLSISPAQSADVSAAQVRRILAACTAYNPADLSDKDLRQLELINIDLKHANR
jgi:hypothetical protein